MRAIKERFLYCLIGIVLCAGIAVRFAFSGTWHAVIAFAAAAIVLMFFAIRMFESYQAARLITENPILKVGVASVSETGDSTAESTVNVVVSGFGILMDGKPYKFGHGGIELTEAKIDREHISFAFGGEGKQYCVSLLHGVADKAAVDKLTERLRYETGVVADVTGW